MWLLAITSIVQVIVIVVKGRPDGAPISACVTLKPGTRIYSFNGLFSELHKLHNCDYYFSKLIKLSLMET